MTKYPIIDTCASKPQPSRVTGQYVARARLSRKQKGGLGAALVDGAAEVTPLTVKQAAQLVGVPTLDVSRARRANGHGHGNGKANGPAKPGPNAETLAQHIARSSPAERVAAARTVGVDVVWDTMVAPVIATERAAE